MFVVLSLMPQRGQSANAIDDPSGEKTGLNIDPALTVRRWLPLVQATTRSRLRAVEMYAIAFYPGDHHGCSALRTIR